MITALIFRLIILLSRLPVLRNVILGVLRAVILYGLIVLRVITAAVAAAVFMLTASFSTAAVALIAALRQYVFVFFHNAFPAFYLSLQNNRFAFC